MAHARHRSRRILTERWVAPLSLADLFRATAALGPDEETRGAIAELLGFRQELSRLLRPAADNGSRWPTDQPGPPPAVGPEHGQSAGVPRGDQLPLPLDQIEDEARAGGDAAGISSELLPLTNATAGATVLPVTPIGVPDEFAGAVETDASLPLPLLAPPLTRGILFEATSTST
jgi:hypothetical protein